MDTAISSATPLTVNQPVLRLQTAPGSPEPTPQLLDADQFIVNQGALDVIRNRATTGVLAPEQSGDLAVLLSMSDPRVQFAHLAAMAAASAPAGTAVAQFVSEQMAAQQLPQGMQMEVQPLLLTEDLVARDGQGGAYLSPDKRLAFMQPGEYAMTAPQLHDYVAGYRSQAGFDLAPCQQLEQAENEWQQAISALQPDQLDQLQHIEDEVKAQVAAGQIGQSDADVTSASRQAAWCMQAYHDAIGAGHADEANRFLPILTATDKYMFAQQRMAAANLAHQQVKAEDLPPAMRERIDGARTLLADMPAEYQPLVSSFAAAIENYAASGAIDDQAMAAIPEEQRGMAREVLSGGLATMGEQALHPAVRPFTTASLVAGFLAETQADNPAAQKVIGDVQHLSLSLVSSMSQPGADGKPPEQTLQEVVTRLPAEQQQTFGVLDQAAAEIANSGTVSSPTNLLANVPDGDKSTVLQAVYATAANLQTSPAIGDAETVGLLLQGSYAELKSAELEQRGDKGPLQQDLTAFKTALGQLMMQATLAGAEQFTPPGEPQAAVPQAAPTVPM